MVGARKRGTVVGKRAGNGVNRGHLSGLLGYNLRRAQVAAFQDFAETMAPFDVSPVQLGVLYMIEANPGINQTELGTAIGMDRSTVVSVIDRLERRDMVARTPSPGDRRSHALVLSRAGRRFLGTVRPHLGRHEKNIARNLTAAERETLIALLRRLNGI